MATNAEESPSLEVPLKHAAEYEKLGILPMSTNFAEEDPHLSFMQKPHTLTLLFAALGLLCYLGFSRDDANTVANTKAYVCSTCLTHFRRAQSTLSARRDDFWFSFVPKRSFPISAP